MGVDVDLYLNLLVKNILGVEQVIEETVGKISLTKKKGQY